MKITKKLYSAYQIRKYETYLYWRNKGYSKKLKLFIRIENFFRYFVVIPICLISIYIFLLTYRNFYLYKTIIFFMFITTIIFLEELYSKYVYFCKASADDLYNVYMSKEDDIYYFIKK